MRILRNSGRVLMERAAPFEELGHARQVRFQNPNSHQPSIARSPPPRASDRLCLHAPRRFLGFEFGIDGRREISQAVEQRTDRNVCPTDNPRFWQITVTKTFLKWQHIHACHGGTDIPLRAILLVFNRLFRRHNSTRPAPRGHGGQGRGLDPSPSTIAFAKKSASRQFC